MGKQEEIRQLRDADRRFIWHPFTQMQDWVRQQPFVVEEGRDCFLRDISGRWLLDGVSSLWVNLFGHQRTEIDEAIKAQVGRISHSTMLGLSSVPAIQLAERLAGLLGSTLPYSPGPLSKVFYSDNGSTAVEVALKMAFQYWVHKGETRKTAFLSLKNAYHGDTLGAVSVGGIDIFHETFRPLLFRTYQAPSPYCYRCERGLTHPECGIACAEDLGRILEAHHDEIAAVILEPLVQAAGGMVIAPKGYLRKVRELCTRFNVLLIADEVATGFGRTGRMFASAYDQVCPDIICLSKGITGGYLPLAVTVSTDEVYAAFLGEFRELKTFFHGHSYTGNQLGCAAALACLDIFEKNDILGQVREKAATLATWLEEVRSLPHVGDGRSAGLMAGIELVRDKDSREPYAWEERMGWRVCEAAREKGVFLRPLGNVVVIMPPLSISSENLAALLSAVRASIQEATS